MITNDGGSVFPEVRSEDSDGHLASVSPDGNRRDAYIVSKGGICLRDWFAGQALSGQLAFSPQYSFDKAHKPKGVARVCYEMADAMLAEREK